MKNIIDNAFDIDPMGQDLVIHNNSDIIVSEPDPVYDDKHKEVENQFQDIYNKALNAFDAQVEASTDIEGKFLARNSEVANQLLTTALNAAKEKANLKKHSDHLNVKRNNVNSGNDVGGTTNIQNNILMDRNQLLKMMKGDES